MTDAPSVALRDAIFVRLATDAADYTTRRKTPVPQLQSSALPALSVFVLSHLSVPDGDGNTGEVRFLDDVTIGVAVTRGFDDPVVLEGTIATEAEAIKSTLFRDPTFVRFGTGALFESVERISQRWIFPEDAESYFIELRLEITFRTRSDYPPLTPDDFEKLRVTYAPTAQTTNPPDDRRTTIVREWTEQQDPP